MLAIIIRKPRRLCEVISLIVIKACKVQLCGYPTTSNDIDRVLLRMRFSYTKNANPIDIGIGVIGLLEKEH